MVTQFGAVARNCKNLKDYLDVYTHDGQSIGIIKEQTFTEAGLSDVYKSLGTVNNGGVGIAWGHGLGMGGCGSSFFMQMKQDILQMIFIFTEDNQIIS